MQNLVRALLRITLLGGGLLATSCVTKSSTVSLRLASNVDEASVTIDDQYLGQADFVEKHGVALPAGKHRVTIEKPGYFPFDRIVEAKTGDAPILLEVELQKIPD